MWADVVNGAFELGGALANVANVLALYRAKRVQGVNIWASAFFTSWGVWNLYFYPSLGQWWSAAGALAIVLVNGLWVGMAIYYTRRVYGPAGFQGNHDYSSVAIRDLGCKELERYKAS